MDRKECKNHPLIEELKKLREKIEILEKRLECYEKLEKHSGNSSLPSSSDKNKKYYPPRKNMVKKQEGKKGIKDQPKCFMILQI